MADRENRDHPADEFITSIDWDRLARSIGEPLDEYFNDPEFVEHPDLPRKVFDVAMEYISDRVENECWQAIVHALNALKRKLIFEAIVEGMRAVHGDTATVRKLQRISRRVVRQLTDESARPV